MKTNETSKNSWAKSAEPYRVDDARIGSIPKHRPEATSSGIIATPATIEGVARFIATCILGFFSGLRSSPVSLEHVVCFFDFFFGVLYT